MSGVNTLPVPQTFSCDRQRDDGSVLWGDDATFSSILKQKGIAQWQEQRQQLMKFVKLKAVERRTYQRMKGSIPNVEMGLRTLKV